MGDGRGLYDEEDDKEVVELEVGNIMNLVETAVGEA